MSIWGKIIGGLCGLMLGGPFGLVLGVIIGHIFDRGLAQHRQGWQFNTGNQSEAQRVFFNATFLVMGHLSKADGRVSEAEIRAARAVMDRMGLNEKLRQQAMELFARGKQTDFNLDQTLQELLQTSHHNKILLRLFLELQMSVANADGLSPAKQRILQYISQRLGFAPLNFAFFEDIFRQYYQQQQGSQQQGYRPVSRHAPSLNEAYGVLNIPESSTDENVKKAYRRLMSQHHPDKLVSKGLPEEMLKLATEKTQNIKAAYERICAARGM
jgi:DnaJ like chaperone protein